MSNEDAKALQDAAKVGRFLTGRSRINRVWYFVGVCCEILILLVGVMAAAGLNNPTGTAEGVIFLAIIFPAIALWIHICLVIGRVRDAGSHWFLGLLLAIAPYAWIAVTLELIEYIWIIMVIVFIGLYAAPALLKAKAGTVAQA